MAEITRQTSDAEISQHVTELAAKIRAAGFASENKTRAFGLWELAHNLRTAAERFEERRLIDQQSGGTG